MDLFGSEAAAGKSLGTDLAKGKLTLPLLLTWERATAAERAELEELIANWHPGAMSRVTGLLARYEILGAVAGSHRRLSGQGAADVAGVAGDWLPRRGREHADGRWGCGADGIFGATNRGVGCLCLKANSNMTNPAAAKAPEARADSGPTAPRATPDAAAEQELVRRARRGDLEAYDDLVRRYQQRIYATIYHMTANHEDANDLAQDAFIKAYQALKSFKGGSSFYTWVYRIAVNKTINFLKQRKNRSHMSLNDLDFNAEHDPDMLALVSDKTPRREAGFERVAGKIERGAPEAVRTSQIGRYFARCAGSGPRRDRRDHGM